MSAPGRAIPQVTGEHEKLPRMRRHHRLCPFLQVPGIALLCQSPRDNLSGQTQSSASSSRKIRTPDGPIPLGTSNGKGAEYAALKRPDKHSIGVIHLRPLQKPHTALESGDKELGNAHSVLGHYPRYRKLLIDCDNSTGDIRVPLRSAQIMHK